MSISPAIKEAAIRQLQREGTHVTTLTSKYGITRGDAIDLADSEGFFIDDQDRFVRKPALSIVPTIDVPSGVLADLDAAIDQGLEISERVLAINKWKSSVESLGGEVGTWPVTGEPDGHCGALGPQITTANGSRLCRCQLVPGHTGQHGEGTTFWEIGGGLSSGARASQQHRIGDLLEEAASLSDHPRIASLLNHVQASLDTLKSAVEQEAKERPLRIRRDQLLKELNEINHQLATTELVVVSEDEADEPPYGDGTDPYAGTTRVNPDLEPEREFVRSIPGDGDYARAVREWCHHFGVEVSTHGRIGKASSDAYEAWWTE